MLAREAPREDGPTRSGSMQGPVSRASEHRFDSGKVRVHPLRGRQDAPNGRPGSPTTASPDKNGESVGLVIVSNSRPRVVFACAVRRDSPSKVLPSFG